VIDKGLNMTDQLDLIETIAREPSFSTFARYMTMSNANEMLSAFRNYTVFVPTNEAFAKIPDKKMNALLQEPGQAQLRALIAYHIVPGKIMASNISMNAARGSLNGEEIRFEYSNGVKVNGAGLQLRNIEAANGVVHSLGTVLTPTPKFCKTPLPLERQTADKPRRILSDSEFAGMAASFSDRIF
jgi:uncharacterized surface protein with fasciclin (FAS1) repeats